jgi:DNA polymerase III alpha subunit
MKSDQYGQLIYNQNDLIDLLMQGRDMQQLSGLLVDDSVQVDRLSQVVKTVPDLLSHQPQNITVEEFDQACQTVWHMPDQYKKLDIAAHVLSLCRTPEELQRCGTELLLYQERNLFDLLRYLTYLVNVMKSNNIIWGVGRGSSVASYVLYLLGVHRIDSMYFDLDISEFLR